MSTLTEYLLVIDTDSYAGNFERQLCAFATGEIGECQVGDEEQDLFFEAAAEAGYSLGFPADDDDNLALRQGDWTLDYSGFEPPFGDLITQKSDDGCYRPVNIRQSPDLSSYNSVEIYFAELPCDEDFAFIKQRIYEFPKYWAGRWAAKKEIKILGVCMIQRRIETVETEVFYE